jgi:hypothetical protein
MNVYWDKLHDRWMLDVNDLSSVPLDEFIVGGERNMSISSGGSTFVGGSNPFLNQEQPSFWRSYTAPADQWYKVIYQATVWQNRKFAAGTCTRVTCDPAAVTLERARFLQRHSSALLTNRPYHWLYNNCETAAVWCKTGEYCTLQALSVLNKIASGQKAASLLLAAAAATATVGAEVTAVVPAAGIWGWMGMTTTATTVTQVPLLTCQPWLIAAFVAYRIITVEVPAQLIKYAEQEWNIIATSLNDHFRFEGFNI